MSCNRTYTEPGSNDFRYRDSYVRMVQFLLLKEKEKNA